VEYSQDSGCKKLAKTTLQCVPQISRFRQFLTLNHDAIVDAANGYRVSWKMFLMQPEIRAHDFRDADGKPVTPARASSVWLAVRESRARAASGGSPQPSPVHPVHGLAEPRSGLMLPDPSHVEAGSSGHLVVRSATEAARERGSRESELFDKPVVDGSVESAILDLLSLEPGNRKRIPDGARAIAARISRNVEK
jgi:hypothetical protein